MCFFLPAMFPLHLWQCCQLDCHSEHTASFRCELSIPSIIP